MFFHFAMYCLLYSITIYCCKSYSSSLLANQYIIQREIRFSKALLNSLVVLAARATFLRVKLRWPQNTTTYSKVGYQEENTVDSELLNHIVVLGESLMPLSLKIFFLCFSILTDGQRVHSYAPKGDLPWLSVIEEPAQSV